MGMSVSDEANFRAFVSSRQQGLRRTAFLMCGDWHAADDLVQTRLTKLYVAWPRLERDRPPDGYVYRILANAVIDERRRPWRREVDVESIMEWDSPDIRSGEAEERLDMAAALKLLPQRQRVTLVLRFWADASVAETAHALTSCSTGTVKSQTARGLTTLRSLLGAEHVPLTAQEEGT
jgi:RNA polymerase sigma-70 factor (sigma-E family)